MLPVKWIPPKSGCLKITSPAVDPSMWIKFITPSGRPASLNTSIITFAEYIWDLEAFHTTVLPIKATLEHKLPAMDVKLKGLSAKMKPSIGLYSKLFFIPLGDIGWSE